MRMLAVEEVFDWNTPSINEPFVVPEEVMFSVDATKVGVTDIDTLKKASEVTVRVCDVLTPLWKPMPENVATPLREVVVVELMLVVVPAMVC